jgi:hypothetical protein
VDAGAGGGQNVRLIPYPNISSAIGAVVGQRLATLRELQTVYGAEDLHKLVEIAYVDGLNRQNAEKE